MPSKKEKRHKFERCENCGGSGTLKKKTIFGVDVRLCKKCQGKGVVHATAQ